MTLVAVRTLLYVGLASFGFMALRFLLVPIRIKLLTSLLDKEGYGALTLVSLSVSFLAVLFAVGSHEFLRAKCPGQDEDQQLSTLAGATRLGGAITAAFGVPLLGLFLLWQPAKLNLGAPDYLIAAALVLLTLVVVQRVFFLLGQQRFMSARVAQLLQADAWFLPVIPFWFLGTLSVRWVLWIWLGWMVLTAVLTHRWTRSSAPGGVRIAPVPARVFLVYGLPLLPMTLGHWLFRVQDRYMLVWLQDAVAVANYSLCLNIALVGYLAGMSLVEIFTSSFFRHANGAGSRDLDAVAGRPEVRDLLQLMIRYGLIIAIPAAAALVHCGEAIILVLSSAQFLDTAPLLAWTAPAAILYLLFFILGRLLMALDRNAALGLATLLGAFLNFVLNLVLVPPLAERGAAVATAISLLVLCLALAWMVRLPRWLSLSALCPLRLLALYAACAGGLYLVQHRFSGHPLGILFLGGLWCLAAPFLLGLIRRRDIALMRECVETKPKEAPSP